MEILKKNLLKPIDLKTTVFFILGMIAGVLIIFQLAFRSDKKVEDNDVQKTIPQLYLPTVPPEISFAGEKVPLDRWDVNEAFDRELIYNYNNAGHISYLLKLSKRYFPMIEKKLKENDVPDDFKYLCVAESNLQNLASGVGAKGFWQFMKDTGSGYGLEINDNVDERYDMEKSTDVACKYLKQAFSKFGNWTAAAASYNCGMGRFGDVSSFQQTKYYYDLQLPDETNKYIFRILSFKYLMNNAKEFGYMVDDANGYQPIKIKTIAVDAPIANLAQWALDHGSTYKMLKILNPWLRDRSLIARSGKTYIIKLPN